MNYKTFQGYQVCEVKKWEVDEGFEVEEFVNIDGDENAERIPLRRLYDCIRIEEEADRRVRGMGGKEIA